MPNAYFATMPLAEWMAQHEHFSAAFVASGAPADCALFVRSKPGREGTLAVFCPTDRMALFTLPADWKSGPVDGSGWALLVGHHDAADVFQVILGDESTFN